MEAPQPLVGRYRFLRTFQGAPSGAIWLASDTMQDQTVVAATVSGPRSLGLKRIVGLQHPHLATVLDYIEQADPREVPGSTPIRRGTGVAVAEYTAGQTLHERLEQGKPSTYKAVAWMQSIATALAAIHARSGVHGALSPRSIVVARTDGGVVPVLTNLRAIANGAYCSPERVRGAGPSPQDDAWALCATLYTAVTGVAPFGGKTRDHVAQAILAGSTHRLIDHGVDEPALQGILSRGLDASAAKRPRSVAELERELSAWLRTQPVPESDSTSSAPPPNFSPQSIPPPHIDDEAVSTAVTRSPSSVAPQHSSSVSIPRIRGVMDSGEQAVLTAPTERLDAPQLSSLMYKMGHRPEPQVQEEDEDDETAVMSAPELEGLRQQVIAADRLVRPPAAEPPLDQPEPDDKTLKDTGIQADFFRTPPVSTTRAAAPGVEPPAQRPKPAPAAAPRPEWPSRSLFDSLTDEGSVPDTPPGINIVPLELTPQPPPDYSQDPRVAAHRPADSYAQVPAPASLPDGSSPFDAARGSLPYAPSLPDIQQGKSSRVWLWISLVLVFIASFVGSAVLGVMFRDKLPFSIPTFGKPQVHSAAPTSPPPSASTASTAGSGDEQLDSGIADSPAPPASSSSQADVEAPPAASASAAPALDSASCIVGFFPTDTFVRTVPLDYVCNDDDPRTVTLALHRMLVKGGAGAVTGGMKIWSALTWYELVVVQVLRDSCCPGARPFTWPPAEGTCPALGPLAQNVAEKRRDDAALKAAEQAFEEAIRCYFTGGLPRPYRYNGVPVPNNRATFDSFVRELAR